MPAPPAYLDECVDHALVAILRRRGFTVTSALEQGRANLGFSDSDQLMFATERDMVLISYNERHFRALSADRQRQGQAHGGIVIVPAGTVLERLTIRAAMMLDWLGTMPDHRSRLFKWGHLQELLEQGFRLEGYGLEEVRLALAR
jgi:hypothetical protein